MLTDRHTSFLTGAESDALSDFRYGNLHPKGKYSLANTCGTGGAASSVPNPPFYPHAMRVGGWILHKVSSPEKNEQTSRP